MRGSRAGDQRWKYVVAVAVVIAASSFGTLLLAPGGSLTPSKTLDDTASTIEPAAGEPVGSQTPTATSTPRPPRNPWRKDPIVVGITDTAGRNRNYVPLVRESLAYWEAQSATHGSYAANYALRPNTSDPDIEITFVSDIETCGRTYSELTVGCAPKLDGDDFERTSTAVRIEGDLNDSSTVVTLKHELGHTLGLSHGYSDTLPFMNASVETSRQPMTDAVDKTNPWETDSLDVHVDYTESVHRFKRDEYTTEIREGLEYWNGGARGYAPENLTLSITRNESEADIVVRFSDSVSTGDGTGHLVRRGGYDPDGDGRLESFTYATVTISKRGDEDLVDWNVAAAVGYLLGHTEEDERAPPFDGEIEKPDEWTD